MLRRNVNGMDDYLKSKMRINSESVAGLLISFIREHMEKLERDGVILGLSGGVDSAVIASLCVRAVGAEKTLALIMPERDSDRRNIKDAISFARHNGIDMRLINISPYLETIGAYRLFPFGRISILRKISGRVLRKLYELYTGRTGQTPFSISVRGVKGREFSGIIKRINAYYRLKHRVRMLLLYFYAELENRLVVGCANKTEYMIGYFVRHGCDDAVDIMPLLNLYKTQVIELAGYLSIPDRIIKKPPSPDIIPGITDEIAIGLSYEKLDHILLAIEDGFEDEEIANALQVDDILVLRVRHLTEASEYMRVIYTP